MTDASSEKQYKEAKQKELTRKERRQRDLIAILNTPEGRRYLWELMGRAGVFESVWENSAKIHFNAGQQDFGRSIMHDVLDAGEEFYFNMMSEHRKDKQ